MKIAIACETQFHLLNAINYAYNQLPDDSSIDLYVIKGNGISSDMLKRLVKTNIFRRVIVYQYKKNDLSKKIYHVIKDKFFRVLFLKNYINSRILNGSIEYDYDYIFASIVTRFIFGLISFNKKAKVVYYDDGLGSYIDNYDYNLYRRSSFLFKLLGRNTNYLNPTLLYVNNKNFCKKTITKNVKEFFSFKNSSKQFWDKVAYIFELDDDSIYDQKKIVYLSMPNDFNMQDFDVIVNNILGTLYGCDCVIRPHPRDTFLFPKDLLIDKSNEMWEIVSAKHITEQHVLIGAFSTAQMTPKMIYNTEPTLIFLFKLYKEAFSKEQIDKFEELIELLKSTYKDKDKIHIVNDLSELREIICKLKETYNG